MSASVIVRGTSTGYAQQITAGDHALRADEPVSLGGSNTGPTPYELLLAALGSCTSITISMYARRKKWPLEAISVEVRYGQIHAQDCADCETTVGMVDQIEREITLIGPLDAAQRERLLEIANKCPVHRTLTSEIKIRTRLT